MIRRNRCEPLRLCQKMRLQKPRDRDEADAVTHALERFGAVFLGEGDGMGGGVRLRFTRLDTRQIGRLENEGGAVGEDDVP